MQYNARGRCAGSFPFSGWSMEIMGQQMPIDILDSLMFHALLRAEWDE